MDNEDRKKLKKEYDNFSRKNYSKIIAYPIYFAFGFSLIIFLLPTDILTQYPSLRYFTKLMANIFPNIDIFASRSKIPELTEFYFSYMWLIAILMIVYAITLIPKLNEEVKEYFGIGKYQGKGKLPKKFFIFYSYKRIMFYSLVGIIFMGFAFYANYTGSIIDDGILRLRFSEIINTKFGMLFLVNLFQTGSLCMIVMIFINNIIQIIQIKNKDKK